VTYQNCYDKTPSVEAPDVFSIIIKTESICPYSNTKIEKEIGRINLKEDFPDITELNAKGIISLVEFTVVTISDLKKIIENFKDIYPERTPNSPRELFTVLEFRKEDYKDIPFVNDVNSALNLSNLAYNGDFTPAIFYRILSRIGIITPNKLRVNYFDFFDSIVKLDVSDENKVEVLKIFNNIFASSKLDILNTAIAVFNSGNFNYADMNFVNPKRYEMVEPSLVKKFILKPAQTWLNGIKKELNKLQNLGCTFTKLDIDYLEIGLRDKYLEELSNGLSFLAETFTSGSKVPNMSERTFINIRKEKSNTVRVKSIPNSTSTPGINTDDIPLYTRKGEKININRKSQCPFFEQGYFTQES
jgi:hypothetical protein